MNEAQRFITMLSSLWYLRRAHLIVRFDSSPLKNHIAYMVLDSKVMENAILSDKGHSFNETDFFQGEWHSSFSNKCLKDKPRATFKFFIENNSKLTVRTASSLVFASLARGRWVGLGLTIDKNKCRMKSYVLVILRGAIISERNNTNVISFIFSLLCITIHIPSRW